MNNKYIFILTVFISSFCLNASAQVLYFNGLGRALVTNDGLSGNILEPADKSTPRKATGGYTVLDLGFNIQPGDYLRASTTLRVRNEFGGFYGDGSMLTFRQMKLDGIIGKKVKYELGDIDMSLTPYTLFNFNESYFDHEAEIFSIRRSIVNYENFNFGNKWRVQGLNSSTNFKFNKGIERIGLRAFVTTLKRANYITNTIPERFQFGGRFDVLQSKFFQVGLNYIAISDIAGTSPSPVVALNNNVTTVDFKLNLDLNKVVFSLYGEGGISTLRYDSTATETFREKSDYFYDGGVSGTFKPLNLKLYVNYRNVGADFNSPGAQTRRILDYGVAGVFPTYKTNNIAQSRQPALFDRYSDEGSNPEQVGNSIRNTNILDTLVAYNPMYNNITPYGIATPNRKGLSVGASVGDDEKVLKADINLDLLGEVINEVNNNYRKYTGVRGGLSFNLHKLVKFEKMIILSGGISNENTSRNSDKNKVDLKTSLIDAGLVVELFKSFDLLGGYKILNAKGTEILPRRNNFNELVTDNVRILNYNTTQSTVAMGMRYRFSKNSFATVQWHQQTWDDKLVSKDYKIKQLFLNYTMIF